MPEPTNGPDAPAELVPVAAPLTSDRRDEAGVAVDLTALLLKPTVMSPATAVTASVDADETTRWFVAGADTTFTQATGPTLDAQLVLLVRAPVANEPEWQVLLRDQLHVGGLTVVPALASGAILFVRTSAGGKEQFVAWCFGQGSRWIRRQATTSRFGLLAALNAMAAAELAEQDGIGVTGASLAARDGNLREQA